MFHRIIVLMTIMRRESRVEVEESEGNRVRSRGGETSATLSDTICRGYIVRMDDSSLHIYMHECPAVWDCVPMSKMPRTTYLRGYNDSPNIPGERIKIPTKSRNSLTRS